MTPCEELGYKVGDKFVVIEYTGYNENVKVGDIITLVQDDGSLIPYFSSDRNPHFVCNLKRVKPYIGDRTMTLLELLVQELPKRGGWPRWAAAAVQDKRGKNRILFVGEGYRLTYGVRRWSSVCDKGSWGIYCNTGSDFDVDTLASDHATRIVTREEYEQATKPAQFEKVRSMLEDVVRQLTDATSVQLDNDGSLNLHLPAGYHVQTPLQRIEQLRKARDEAVRAYNDAFVSGEAELRKLKLGDKIILSAESDRYDGLVLKLVKIEQFISGDKDHCTWWFVDDKGSDYGVDKFTFTRFAPL